MCHILWVMPILALPLFWFLDFWVALPLYLVILAISAVVQFLTIRSFQKPASSGMEGMRGDTAEVVEALHPRGTVRYHSEFWSAEAREPIQVGETVRIVGNKGIRLLVEKLPEPHVDSDTTGPRRTLPEER
jgi:membrane-bound ClpP family serine protease